MKRRPNNLAPILAAALIVAVSWLGYVIYRDYLRNDRAEMGERPRLAKAGHRRELPRSPIDPPRPEDVEVRALPALSPGPTNVVSAALISTPSSRSVGLLAGAASEKASAPPDGNGGGEWDYADVVPEIAKRLLEVARGSLWPEGVFAPSGEFRIGVLRDDSMRRSLTSILHGDPVSGHPAEIIGREQAKALVDCLMVFVGDFVQAADAQAIFHRRPIMTVTCTGNDRADTWCDVELFWHDGQLGFVVDRNALARKRITVSDTLLELDYAWLRDGRGQMVRLRPVPSAPARKEKKVWF